MGYRVDQDTADLTLSDMDGALVTVRISVPLAAIREWDLATTRDDEWAVFLREAEPTWNLEDKDGPIPVDAAAIDRLPAYVSAAIQTAWRDAAVHPPLPLRPTFSAGTR